MSRQLSVGTLKRQPATVNRYFEWLRKVLNLAVRDGKLQSNPVCRLKLSKESKGKTRFLSLEEEGKLLEAMGPTHGPWARLAILTGMRQTEQFSLKWADVNLERGLITLPVTKAGDVQYVPLNDEAKQILEGLTVGNRSVWVFPSENPDTYLDPRNFYDRVWTPAVKRAGIEWISWHDLRHTFASRLAMAGHNEGTIAALLRHSSTALVKRYTHLSPSHLHAAVESVAAFGKGREGEKHTLVQTHQVESIPNATVTSTGTVNSVGERSGVEVAEKIGAPDTN
jgi:integrase